MSVQGAVYLLISVLLLICSPDAAQAGDCAKCDLAVGQGGCKCDRNCDCLPETGQVSEPRGQTCGLNASPSGGGCACNPNNVLQADGYNCCRPNAHVANGQCACKPGFTWIESTVEALKACTNSSSLAPLPGNGSTSPVASEEKTTNVGSEPKSLNTGTIIGIVSSVLVGTSAVLGLLYTAWKWYHKHMAVKKKSQSPIDVLPRVKDISSTSSMQDVNRDPRQEGASQQADCSVVVQSSTG